jgi:GcrA cell cycle regulator
MRFYNEEEALRVREAWKAGYSAGQIARMLGTGRSRNSIIGFVHRHLTDLPGRKASCPAVVRNPRKARTGPKLTPHSAKTARPAMIEQPPALMLPLDALTTRQCRYACNDAELGETHLFCGARTNEGSNFCEYHRAICYTPLPPQSRRKRADILYLAGL